MALKRIMRRKAANDIKKIAIYTEKTWGREQRKKYLHGLSVCIDEIADRPTSGLSRSEIHPGLRSMLYGEHVIFFLPTPTSVAIIRVLHQTMNISQWFPPEDFVDTL